MFLVKEIFTEARKIFRGCDETLLFEKIGDSVELLANKGEVDPLVGYLDICADSSQCLTLPREVETILALNVDGHPTMGINPLHTFHLNGPGDFLTVWKSWTDVGNFPTYRDLPCPGKLVAFLDSEADQGAELRVFGFDDENRPLRTQVNGVWSDGYLVPTVFGFALPDAFAPVISRITHVLKANTVGDIRLSSFDNSATVNSTTGTLLGIYEPNETKPLYRRIKLWRNACWVRICYRKRTYRIFSQYDRILLHSRLALILAMRAIRFYDDTDISNATTYEAHAVRILTEKEASLEGPSLTPIQVNDRNSIKNAGYDEVQ
jgi:hypothetical protein